MSGAQCRGRGERPMRQAATGERGAAFLLRRATEFPAHRVVLAAASGYFAALWAHGFKVVVLRSRSSTAQSLAHSLRLRRRGGHATYPRGVP